MFDVNAVDRKLGDENELYEEYGDPEPTVLRFGCLWLKRTKDAVRPVRGFMVWPVCSVE